jgi:hypothetical protein
MKKILPLLVIAAVSVCSSTVHAKGKKDQTTTGTYGCAKFDVNENGILDPDEIEALRKAFAEGDTALKPLDVNNDGKLDDAEIAAIKLPQPAKKKKKNA